MFGGTRRGLAPQRTVDRFHGGSVVPLQPKLTSLSATDLTAEALTLSGF